MTSRRPDHIPARKAFSPKVRQAIYDRSGGACEACGVEIAPDNWHAEKWRPVVGFEGFYDVSDHGRVYSHGRAIKNSVPGTIRRIKGRMLSLNSRHGGGYVQVSLHNRVRPHKKKVHNLVLEAFVGPRPDGMVACHADGNPTNNHISNLRWDTPKANLEDAKRHGVIPMGEAHYLSKLTEQDVYEVRRMISDGVSQSKIGARFGVSQGTITDIKRGATWKHLP